MKNSFLGKRIKSVKYATYGAFLLLKKEPSIQVQTSIGVLVTIAGFYFEISREEWLAQTLAIALVLGLEGANTAIEAIADFIHPDFHFKIGRIKDLAAGAVFLAAILAVVIGIIIYLPYIQHSF